ncbi:cysteine desulfurase family protein [Enterococcus timonensis]|uniref:cysteine desulfurase family protein n=1 Tax=Enterococcus timonensis TaxID=1852364 RepID=UPI000A95CDB6|nr:cysteine desulfurase family protein [Enterococcus timonensis]
MGNIYLDHGATTPMHPAVIAAMVAEMENNFGNPSSVHAFGRAGKKSLMTARTLIAGSLNAEAEEIIFNSGGTEGDNTALIETALAQQKFGKHIITTSIEHPAVIEPLHYLESLGFEVTYLPVDEKGQITVQQVADNLREDTILVSIMAANNETGNILPISEIGELLVEHQAIFHTDAVQAYGAFDIDVKKQHIDLLSVSAHKFSGPKGVGFLYKNKSVRLPALLKGGQQEEKRRAGTENLPAIVGMAEAVKILTPLEKKNRKHRYQELATKILVELKDAGIDFSLNGDPQHKLPHVLNLYLKGIHRDVLLMRLDLAGVAVSSGSACTAGTIEPSHVLEAMYGHDAPQVDESIRISLGYENTEDEIDQFLEILIAEVQRLKK